MLWRWLMGAGRDREAYVADWSPLRAEQAYRDTERLLLGACGPVRVVGSRSLEKLLQEREERVENMNKRDKIDGTRGVLIHLARPSPRRCG